MKNQIQNSKFRFILIILLMLIAKSFSQTIKTEGLIPVRIVSDPPNAKVLIDGIEVGFTNFAGEFTAGKKLVEVELSGYKKEKKYIYVHEGIRVTHQFNLKKLNVNLEIALNPSDANITIDNEPQTNQTKYNISSGVHRFLIEKPGYISKKKSYYFKPGEKSLKIILDRKTVSGAVIRSLIFPGWGQGYQDKDKKKYLYQVLFAVSSASLVFSINNYNNLIDDYYQVREKYENAFLQKDIAKYRKEMDAKYSQVETMEIIRNTLAVSVTAIWIWNVIDTIIVPPKWKEEINISTKIVDDNIAVGISIKLD